jgi:hypothetical protein
MRTTDSHEVGEVLLHGNLRFEVSVLSLRMGCVAV